MWVKIPPRLTGHSTCLHLFWPDVKYRVDLPTEASGFYGPIDKRSKSPAFHAGVTGSNPVGITSIVIDTLFNLRRIQQLICFIMLDIKTKTVLYLICPCSSVGLERAPHKGEVAGSIPAIGTIAG